MARAGLQTFHSTLSFLLWCPCSSPLLLYRNSWSCELLLLKTVGTEQARF